MDDLRLCDGVFLDLGRCYECTGEGHVRGILRRGGRDNGICTEFRFIWNREGK